MWRFLLPALAMMGAMSALIFGAVGDLWLSPDLSSGGSAIISHAEPEQAAPAAPAPAAGNWNAGVSPACGPEAHAPLTFKYVWRGRRPRANARTAGWPSARAAP